MNIRQSFLQHLRQPAAPPPERPSASVLSGLVERVFSLLQQARLPQLSEDELRRILPLLDPELRGVASDCIDLLTRRPALGERAGLDAPLLRELLQLDLQLERLGGVSADLGATVSRATSALWGALGAWNARILLFVEERTADESVPLPERHHVQVQFRGALADAEAREARGKGPASALRKADALRARLEAAGKSRAVKDALALLRRFGEKTTDKDTP